MSNVHVSIKLKGKGDLLHLPVNLTIIVVSILAISTRSTCKKNHLGAEKIQDRTLNAQ